MTKPKSFTPEIDMAAIQEKVNEYALKGATEAIKEYYSGYNSPFRKEISRQLSEKSISCTFDLPDVIGLINESLTKEIDMIANTAVAKTFIPMVQRLLVREEKEILFSDILKEFIRIVEPTDYFDCEVSIKESEHEWLDVNIIYDDRNYDLTLHLDYDTKKEAKRKYQLLSLPRNISSRNGYQTMKVKVDSLTLEMPFTPNVLQDEFVSYIAKLVIGNSKISMDTNEFHQDMFPERCHCE